MMISASVSIAQNRPTLTFNIGLAMPGSSFAGELISSNDSGIITINPEFVKSNYAASTGSTVTGTIRFPIGQQGVAGVLLSGSYTFFNAFRRSYLGTTYQSNVVVPVTFDNRLTNSSFSLGFDASPPINEKFRPFANANFTFNILSLTVSRNEIVSLIFSDAFRMGLLFNAGMTMILSDEYSLSLGGSYHMSNMFLRSNKSGYEDRVEFNRGTVPINDEEGSFYTNLSDPNRVSQLVQGTTKNASWWGINLGINIAIGKKKKK